MTKDRPTATRTTRSARQILNGTNHILHSLYAQSREVKSIESVVARYIDGEFAISSLKNNELTIICPSGATATRLRYRQRNILSKLNHAGLELARLNIKVQPINELVPQKTVQRTLSDDNAEQLLSTAASLPEGPLREALVNLAKRRSDD